MSFFIGIFKKPLLIWFYTISFLLINSLCMADVFMAPKDASPERCDNRGGTRFSWNDYASSKGLELAQVRDQGDCGSCWAFAPIGAMEDILALNNVSVILSREFLVGDCEFNGDCDSGGNTAEALNFLQENGTYDVLFDGPLYYYSSYCTTPNGKCKDSCKCGWLGKLSNCSGSCDNFCDHYNDDYTNYKIRHYYGIDYKTKPSPLDWLKLNLKTYGPLVVKSTAWEHAIELIGYDDCNMTCIKYYGKPGCWILKNSWGTHPYYAHVKKYNLYFYSAEGYVYIPYGRTYDLFDKVWALLSIER